MAEHLRQLDGWFTSKDWPAVACPVCSVGHVASEAIECVADPDSRAVFRQSEDPTHMKGVFSGTLQCALAACQATVAVAGDYSVDVDFDDEGAWHYADFVRLRFAHPAFPLINAPERTPASVTDAIGAASSVVFADPSSAANRLRFAVEELLTAHRIPKTELRKSGKRRRLSTQERIALYEAKQEIVAKALEAVKWIGNSGSHATSLSVGDVINGAEILDLALRSLYDRTDARLLRKVLEINKRSGLPRKRSGS